MAKKDQLSALIQSLTPMEKKYFVQFTSLRSEVKSYMKLYSCVLRDKEFNTEKLSKELKKTKANLAHEKEYLIENILKALRNYHDKTKEAELNNMLTDAFILKERGLNELSMSRMKKAMMLAEKYGRNETAWRLRFEERLLAVHLYPEKIFIKEAEKSMNNMQKELDWMNDFTALQKQYFKVEKIYRHRNDARTQSQIKEVKQQLASPLYKKRASEPLFRFYQLGSLSVLHEQLLDMDASLNYQRQCIQLLEKHHRQIPIDTYGYFLVLHAYLLELVSARKFAAFDKLMSKIKTRYYHKLPFNSVYLDTLLDAQSYYYYLMKHSFLISAGTAQPEEMKLFLVDLEKNYASIIAQFPPAYTMLMPHYACGLCFFLKDYDAALRWNQKIINEGNPTERMEVQSVARMVTPILHAELKNYTILPSLVKTARRYLHKNAYLTPVETLTLAFLNKLPLLHNQAEIKNAFTRLKQQYKKLETTEEGLYRLRTFRYRLWVERNLQ